MSETIQLLVQYVMKVLPGLLAAGLLFVFIRPERKLRIVLYILMFVLVRDAMTPMQLWFIGKTKGVLWIRILSNPSFLVLFAVCSLIIVLLLTVFDRENSKHISWYSDTRIIASFFGFVGAGIVVLPYFFLYRGIDIGLRGGAVPAGLLIPLLIFAFCGNLVEELLFRGYVISCIVSSRSILYKGFLSGLVFAVCHVFLATTVTDVGIPLLVFTLWEGTIAGIIGVRYGLIPATLTHGGAVFLLSSGLF